MEQTANSQETVNITFTLKGEKAAAFLRYMEREHIDINSVAAKKLLLERLDQVEIESLQTV